MSCSCCTKTEKKAPVNNKTDFLAREYIETYRLIYDELSLLSSEADSLARDIATFLMTLQRSK